MSIATLEHSTGSFVELRPVPEMRRYLNHWQKEAEAKRSYCELISVEAAQDIHADIEKQQASVCAVIYTEEQRNILNAAELETILADGRVTPDELPRLGKLAQRERKSAHNLHTVTEVLA